MSTPALAPLPAPAPSWPHLYPSWARKDQERRLQRVLAAMTLLFIRRQERPELTGTHERLCQEGRPDLFLAAVHRYLYRVYEQGQEASCRRELRNVERAIARYHSRPDWVNPEWDARDRDNSGLPPECHVAWSGEEVSP